MVENRVSVDRRVEDSLKYYQHVRCNIFPRVRATLSAVSAFGAAASSSPTLQATFATVSALCAGSAVYTHFSRDAFGFSNAVWMRIAKDNLKAARQEANNFSESDTSIVQGVQSSQGSQKLELNRS